MMIKDRSLTKDGHKIECTCSDLRYFSKIRRELMDKIFHELKTPVTSINLASELFIELNEQKLTENSIELLEIIKRNSKRLEMFINNLADLFV